MSLLPTITDEDNVEIFEEDDDGEDDLMLGPASDEEEEEEADGETPKKGKKKAKKTSKLEFDFSGDTREGERPWDFSWALQNTLEKNYDEQTSIDYKIRKQLESRRKRGVVDDDIDDEDVEDEQEGVEQPKKKKNKKNKKKAAKEAEKEEAEEDEEDQEDENEDQIKQVTHKPTKKQIKEAFFEKSETEGYQAESFLDLHLSRALLKAVANLGYDRPTPVQSQAIPIALQGKDVCASATTGSGKTASFVLPILERLIHRDKRIMATRVVILTPTRELAIQCHSVIEKLAKFTDITACLVVGGLSNKVQEAALRRHPDIVVATPGRIIDHLRNAQSFTLETVDILVLDEADRLLSLGFADELEQIIKFCPPNRQTLLFSATMTEEVDRLASLSLNRPVRVRLDPNMRVASGIQQEFIKIKEAREFDRDAMLLALCTRSFKKRVLIFFRAKKEAHRLKVIFGLAGLKAAELHGNLSQNQRLEALEKFRDGNFDYLLATDLAARGLDILGIETIINYNMARTVESYIHRVGRTARWGHSGKSVTFISEQDRKVFKEIMKSTNQKVSNRVIPPKIIDQWREKIDSMKGDISQIFAMEYEEKQLRLTQMEASKTQNMIEHHDEIMSRPPRTWFQTKEQRDLAKGSFLPLSLSSRAKQAISARQAKKADRDRRSGKFVPPPENAGKRGKKRARSDDGGAPAGGGGGGGSRFEADMTQPKKKQKAAGSAFDGEKGGKGGKSGAADGEKKHLGKKRGNKAFKSKKRFQRRK
ncbi:DEAD/DEAH box helicase domain containing protein [Acanthamoeba castellanii str. Neff]|uniref:DEAD/DEAH box helicase domain containing protein n=1 Tax=Acanthamoeba castellanii (strain ATCC 30010 / Neff) TaxID=1257118 RepID=L8H5X4_ACACF|nr:DEAD/DEAH box helicase domain containing protein [Acanthamoeba castellanii str. Neff]ELR20123.1 DEAD/DEAH box helicase domain containing protein [Acanthamoeba castellanii str. Neff]